MVAPVHVDIARDIPVGLSCHEKDTIRSLELGAVCSKVFRNSRNWTAHVGGIFIRNPWNTVEPRWRRPHRSRFLHKHRALLLQRGFLLVVVSPQPGAQPRCCQVLHLLLAGAKFCVHPPATHKFPSADSSALGQCQPIRCSGELRCKDCRATSCLRLQSPSMN